MAVLAFRTWHATREIMAVLQRSLVHTLTWALVPAFIAAGQQACLGVSIIHLLAMGRRRRSRLQSVSGEYKSNNVSSIMKSADENWH